MDDKTGAKNVLGVNTKTVPHKPADGRFVYMCVCCIYSLCQQLVIQLQCHCHIGATPRAKSVLPRVVQDN